MFNGTFYIKRYKTTKVTYLLSPLKSRVIISNCDTGDKNLFDLSVARISVGSAQNVINGTMGYRNFLFIPVE